MNNISKKRITRSLLLRQAVKEIRAAEDYGYDEKRSNKYTKKYKLTLRMITSKFTAFADEFRDYSNPKTNGTIQTFSRPYNLGIGPVLYNGRNRAGGRKLKLSSEAENDLLSKIALLGIREKILGDHMVRILSVGAYWSRTPGKQLLFPTLNRCTVRALLHLYRVGIYMSNRMFASYEDTPPPVALRAITEFWEVSQRFNGLEVEVLANLVPYVAEHFGLGLKPWHFPLEMSRYIEQRRKQLLPLMISKNYNLRDIKRIQTVLSRIWAQNPKAWNTQASKPALKQTLAQPHDANKEEELDTLMTEDSGNS